MSSDAPLDPAAASGPGPVPSPTAAGLFARLQELGFRPTAQGLVGVHRGLPVRVAKERGTAEVLRVVVGLPGPAEADGASRAVAGATLPSKVQGNQVVHGGVVIDLPRKLATGADPQPGLEAVDAVLASIADVPGAVVSPPADAQLTTVDGVPRWLTEQERLAVQRGAEEAAAAYEAIQPNLVGGLLAGAAAAVVVAVAWALLLRYANLQAWIIAIGGGALVAFAAVRVGRRVVVPLQVGVVVLSVVGVMVGQWVGAALVIQEFIGSFELGIAFEALREDVGGSLFALGGAVAGAVVGLRAAAKPEFQRDVSVHH